MGLPRDPVQEIEGIGEVYAQRLRKAGTATTGALFMAGSSPQGN